MNKLINELFHLGLVGLDNAGVEKLIIYAKEILALYKTVNTKLQILELQKIIEEMEATL